MRRIPPLLIFSALLPLAAACRNDEITVRRVPKEAEQAAPVETAGSAHREVDWTAPPGWKEQPATGMRVGSYLASGSEGDVDVSVVTLSGEAGGEIANVNRWLGQLNLPPVDDAGLKKLVRTERVGPHEARVVEFANGEGKRLIAAVVQQGRASWFFKATGPDKSVREVRSAFLAFVGSARFHRHE